MITNRSKIAIIGAGFVGAAAAYALAVKNMASELVLIDVNADKAQGEAMDIAHGLSFMGEMYIHAGGYEEVKDSDIIIVTAGLNRKPGETRLQLAQKNVAIAREMTREIMKHYTTGVILVVSNPVDIITYAILKNTNLSENQVFGSGTMLDSARLRSRLAEHVGLNSKNIHAYVFGEHGDTSMIPWSLTTIAGMEMSKYCTYICDQNNRCGKTELKEIEEDVRTAGAQVIALKGATFYAIALSVRRICECILRDTDSVMTVSAMIHNQYGINDVCLSLPFVVGAQGIRRAVVPPLTKDEEDLLHKSADALKQVISQLEI